MNEEHFNKIADKYDDLRGIHLPLLEELILLLKIDQRCRVLDVGCGTGADLKWIHEQTGAEICGIEPSIEMSRTAKAALGHERVLMGRAEEILDEFDAVFDVVYFKLSFQPLTTASAN